MQRRVGHAAVDPIAAASPKFAAPMVLVHGLWCSAAVWRLFMGYLAHRGWTCHAINLRGRGTADARTQVGQLGFADYLHDVQQVVLACDAPPVVVGHDLGGLLALACDPRTLRAAVALAPLVPHAFGGTANPVLSSWRTRMAACRLRPLPPPRGARGAQYFARGVPGGAVPDSARAARELCDSTFTLPSSGERPTVLVTGDCDPFCPPRDVERLAQRVGAQCHTAVRAGHAMPWEAGWEHRVAETHRWLIQTLGEPLLLMRGDEEE